MAEVAETTEDQIDFWLTIYRDVNAHADVRVEAAANLDRLLRAPAWPT